MPLIVSAGKLFLDEYFKGISKRGTVSNVIRYPSFDNPSRSRDGSTFSLDRSDERERVRERRRGWSGIAGIYLEVSRLKRGF